MEEIDNNKIKNKRIILISIIIVLVVSLVLAGTYALWTWNSNVQKNVIFNTNKGLQNYIVYDAGESKFVGDFQVSDTYLGGVHTTIAINKMSIISNIDLYATINMTIKDIGSNLVNSSALKWTVTRGNSTNPGDVLSAGSFKEHNKGDNIVVLPSEEITTTKTEYTVWIWLDSAENPDETISGETVDASVWTQINQGSSFNNPNQPVLDEGMIPIVFDTSNGTIVKTVSSTDSSWYDYSNQKWANAVLVSTSSRSKYLGTTGVAISESDILAYFVWIPRYSYKIWTTELSSAGQEQTIEIKFQNTNTISTGTGVGEYITHPAFWWDNNSNGVRESGEELSGIWVGKFETTGTGDNPTIKPDVSSLRSQNVSTQFATAQKFGTSTYGITSNTDAHMMKNSEWGAVAYLSHSKYGVNREVYINNSRSYYTGRSGGNVGGSTPINKTYTDQTSTELYNNYGFYTWDGYLLEYDTNTKSTNRDLTKVASTTGNITGVYDMSGGVSEHTMGVFANSSGELWSGFSASYNSGFTGLLGSSGASHTGTAFPESKYYDVYKASSGTTISALTACNGGVCYGHALSEVNNWSGDYTRFVSAGNPWFSRGGDCRNGSDAGVLSFFSGFGNAGGVGFRSSLVVDGA